MDHGDFTFLPPGRVVGRERKWQGLGPTLSIASAATGSVTLLNV